ncbi:MAG: glycosyltransferase [Candidatus Heimdallarchaeota archaeon]
MKILFLSNRSPLPIKDGHTRRTFNILKGLAEKNQVYFLSLYETSEEIEEYNVKELESFCHKVELHPSPSKKFSIPMLVRLLRSLFSREPYTIWRHYSKSFSTRVAHILKEKEFDLVHCDILPIVYAIRNKEDIFRSITDHDVSYLKCLRMAKDSSNLFLKIFCYLEAFKLKKLESQIFNEVELGIVVSEVDKKILQRNCPEGSFEVIENGVAVDRFKPAPNRIEPKTLLWVGGFDHHPNKQGIYWFLDNVYPLIKKKVPKITLYLIGGGVTNKLKRFASADSSIKILGYVDDPIPYLQNATVFIAPILSGSGTRLKLLEAMAVGKAIVTTNIGCEGIEGINKKHYMVSDTPNEFAENVIKIINDRGVWKYLGNNARRLVLEKYDWEIIYNQIDILYRNIFIEKTKII